MGNYSQNNWRNTMSEINQNTSLDFEICLHDGFDEGYRRSCLDSEEAGSKDVSFGVFREFYPGTDQMKKEVWYKDGVKYHAWWGCPSFTEIWYKDGVEVHSEEMFDIDIKNPRDKATGELLFNRSQFDAPGQGVLNQPSNQPEDYDGLDAYWVCWTVLEDGHVVEEISDSRSRSSARRDV